MRRRLSSLPLSLCLSLVLLLAQQLGALHLLSHGLQPAEHGQTVRVQAGSPAVDQADQAGAGDALCQVCLLLATLGVAALPALWGWRARQARAAAPLPPAQPAPARRVAAPYRARGPPCFLP